MSLHGLDVAKVAEAYQNALNEAGGWLLLQYTSRDTVGLHAQGSGGHLDLRDAVAKHQEKAPLYGFLLYRRRKVVLKYIPEGTSRLLQARTAVHFQSVCDHFSPHDTTFNAAAADDISDSALSSSCALHTAGSFTSVSGINKRQYMDEISEDAEEVQSSNPAVSSILARLREDRAKAPVVSTVTSDRREVKDAEDIGGSKSIDHENGVVIGEDLSAPGDELSKRDSNDEELYTFGPSKRSDEETRDDTFIPRPTTSETSRPTFSSWKPKIRLFTRTVSTAPQEQEERDRLALPAGMRIRKEQEEAARKLELARKQQSDPQTSKPQKRPKSVKESRLRTHKRSTSKTEVPLPDRAQSNPEPLPQKTTEANAPDVASSPTAPSMSQSSFPSVASPTSATPVAPNTVRNDRALPPTSNQPTVRKPPAITPERQRLLKALQLRKQQQEVASNGTTGVHKLSEETQVSASDSTKADSGVGIEDIAQTKAGSRKLGEKTVSETIPPAPLDLGTAPTSEIPLDPHIDQNGDVSGTTVPGSVDNLEIPAPKEVSPVSLPDSERGSAARKLDRLTLPDPIDTSVATAHSEGETDDSFMDDLQNATFEEAIPVSIPTTPVNISMHDSRQTSGSGFPLDRQATLNSAMPHNHLRDTSKGSGRSIQVDESGTKKIAPPSLVEVQKAAVNKKNNVSSGISRRIQALEERSQRSSSPTSLKSPASMELPQPFFLPQNHNRQMSMTSRPSSRASSRLNSLRSFQPMDAIRDVSTPPKTPTDKAQTVSITARITRTGRRMSPERSNGARPAAEFQKSQVTVDHSDRAHVAADAGPQRFRRVEPPPSVLSRPESRGSTLSNVTRSSFDIGFKFMGRKRAPDSRSIYTDERSPSEQTLGRVDEDVEEKKKGKASRFFKRMSNMSSSSKRSGKSEMGSEVSTFDNRSIATAKERSKMASRYIVGDLNVQFPDTLFWKRRWVEVDGSGNLVLTSSRPSQKSENRTLPKKYHLSTFTLPAIPSPERQELPYSVVLDFVNGGTLQLASEDRVSQGQVYRRLTDAHTAWVT